jgi:type IV pilus assembly protein PilF
MLNDTLRHISSAMLVFSFILLSSCASKNDLKAKQAGLYFGAGTQSLMSKNYTAALTSLLKANELDPDNSEILNNLAMAYYFKGEEDLAIKHLDKALKINKNNSDSKINLASIHYRAGKISLAETLYKEVLRDLTYDKQARTFYNLGLIELENKKNTVAAVNYFEKSMKEDENYCPSSFQLGLIHYNHKQYNKALRVFKEASLGTCYDSPEPHYYQALSMVKLGKYTDARLKLSEISTKFKKSVFAVKAKSLMTEINDIETRNKSEAAHAFKTTLESPDF